MPHLQVCHTTFRKHNRTKLVLSAWNPTSFCDMICLVNVKDLLSIRVDMMSVNAAIGAWCYHFLRYRRMPVQVGQFALTWQLSLEILNGTCIIPPIPYFNTTISITHCKMLIIVWIVWDMFDFDSAISLKLKCGLFLFTIPHKDTFVEWATDEVVRMEWIPRNARFILMSRKLHRWFGLITIDIPKLDLGVHVHCRC